jgi:hypothetical protein
VHRIGRGRCSTAWLNRMGKWDGGSLEGGRPEATHAGLGRSAVKQTDGFLGMGEVNGRSGRTKSSAARASDEGGG